MFDSEEMNREWADYKEVKALQKKAQEASEAYYGKKCSHPGNSFEAPGGKIRRYRCETCRDALWKIEERAYSYWNPLWEAFEKMDA